MSARPSDADERPRALIVSGVATLVTLAVWFAALAFPRWVTERGVDTGLGPDVLYVAVLPIAMVGLAGGGAWRYQVPPGVEDAIPARRRAETLPVRSRPPQLATGSNRLPSPHITVPRDGGFAVDSWVRPRGCLPSWSAPSGIRDPGPTLFVVKKIIQFR